MLEKEEKDYRSFSEIVHGKSLDDYTKELFLVIISETDLIRRVASLTNSAMIKHLCRMQAQCNLYEKELDLIEENINKLSASDLKHFFTVEYQAVVENAYSMSLNDVASLCRSYAKRASSGELEKWKKTHTIRYLDLSLLMSAIDEVFKDDLDKIEKNIRERN